MHDEPPFRSATQRDIAIALGLTQATVSMALRGHPKIPEKRRQEIQDAAYRLGYRPSPAAAAMAQLRHSHQSEQLLGAIAWLNFWSEPSALRSKDEFNHYFLGAAEAATKFGYKLYEFSRKEAKRSQRLEAILHARGIDGVLLPPHREAVGLDEIDWQRFSIIKFGHSLPSPRGHAVSSNQLHNAMLALREIRARGYRRVGFVNAAIDYWLFDAGFQKAQQDLPPGERIPILNIDQNHALDQLPVLREWIREYKPDAIFSSLADITDMLQRIGYSVPGDIAVAVTSVLDGKADSGIDQNPKEIGRIAVLSLLSLLHDNDRGEPTLDREVLVKGRWVDGASLPPKRQRTRRSR